jgi:Uma2 family endonuclease
VAVAGFTRIVRGVAVREQPSLEELHRYSLEEYHRLIDAGGFDEDQRVELLDGLLVSMSPKTPAHERTVRWLARWLMHAIDEERHEVGVGSPLTLATSEPEPDLTVLEQAAAGPYHPSRAALVVEVAVSSLARDLGVKASLYGAAGIAEYWVVDLAGRRIVVHRGPTEDGYAERSEVTPGGRLTAAALGLPPLDLEELLRAAGA